MVRTSRGLHEYLARISIYKLPICPTKFSNCCYRERELRLSYHPFFSFPS